MLNMMNYQMVLKKMFVISLINKIKENQKIDQEKMELKKSLNIHGLMAMIRIL